MRHRFRLVGRINTLISRKDLPNLLFILIGTVSLLALFKRAVLSITIQHVSSSTVDSTNEPFYIKSHSFSCQSIFEGKESDIKLASTESLQLESDYQLWMAFGDCEQVRKRFFYAKKPMSEEEANFPLAYSILFYQDLLQAEILLSAIYAPQNTYCIHVDLKAAQVISDGLKRFASCFPNILIPDERYPVTSDGVNMIRAYRSCLSALVKADRYWRYVYTLQSQDFPLRTNLELVQIAKILNGANDVELLPGHQNRLALRLKMIYDEHGMPLELNTNMPLESSVTMTPVDGLTVYKGSVSATMSRQFVEKIISHEKAVQLVNYLDNAFLADELYWATLNHNEKTFPVPGGYPGRCVSAGRKDWLTRFTVWQSYSDAACHGQWRHYVCVFGVGDLPRLSKRPEMFVNKFSTRSVQPIASFCMHELLFNRTHFSQNYLASSYGFNRTWYENSAPTVYRRWELKMPSITSGTEFECVQCVFNCEH